MNSLAPTSLKSRIPVLTQKSFNVNNDVKQPTKAQTLSSCNATQSKDSDGKRKVQPFLRTNVTSNSTKEFPSKTNVKSVKTVLLKSKSKTDGCKEKASLNTNLKSCDKEKKQLLNGTKLKESGLKSNAKSAVGSKDKNLLLKTKTKADCSREKVLSSPRTHLKQDEKCTPAKENKVSSKRDCSSAQKDIKFEANEMYRNMILREPSPGRLNIASRRASAYDQIMEVVADPFQEAMRAIENLSLSKKRDLKSVRVISPIFKDRGSFYTDRGSFYTPGLDPKLEVMKSLEKLKLKQLQKSALKSTKKVTFDLNVKEYTPQNTWDRDAKSFKNSDRMLTQINEKSEENTPNSPVNERPETSVSEQTNENSSKPDTKKKDAVSPEDINVKKHNTGTFCTPITTEVPTISVIDSEELSSVHPEKLVLHNSIKTNCVNSSPDFARIQNKNDDILVKSQRPINFQTLEQKTLDNDENIKIIRTKVYTPRPISLYSQTQFINSSSPEFLEKGASEALIKFAPICTPLFLKSIAKSTVFSPPNVDLSPVRVRLDFTEKETPRPKTPKISNLGNVVTAKSKLDELADKECSTFLLNESFPVVCGRYLPDPVATTLSAGDNMHFLPIQ